MKTGTGMYATTAGIVYVPIVYRNIPVHGMKRMEARNVANVKKVGFASNMVIVL
jgi:hypothetical protein